MIRLTLLWFEARASSPLSFLDALKLPPRKHFGASILKHLVKSTGQCRAQGVLVADAKSHS